MDKPVLPITKHQLRQRVDKAGAGRYAKRLEIDLLVQEKALRKQLREMEL